MALAEMISFSQMAQLTAANAKAGFIKLPRELHDMICGFVSDTQTLANLRDTCKTMHEKTVETYQKRQFSTLEINLTVKDLKYVVKVSKHEHYSPIVRKIVIRPGFLDRRTCRAGSDTKLLEPALSKLKHLKSIEILPFEVENGPVRARANALVPAFGDRSWNPNFLARANPSLVHDPISHAFLVVQAALRYSKSLVHFQAGTVPLPTGERNSVDHSALRSPPNAFVTRLESFHLVAGAQGSSLNIEVSLSSLISPMQNLKRLRLEFWGYHVEWLSKTFEVVTLPHLQELQIHAARKVKATALKDFVQRHKKTLESLDLSIITFDDDELAKTFPFIFQDLRLKELKLSQFCSARHGLLLLGGTCEIICDACNKDLSAAWKFKTGPHCTHASIHVTGSELAVSRELAQRLEIVDLLPWPARPPPPVIIPAADEASEEVQESESEDVEMEDQTVSLIDTLTTPVATSSAASTNLANTTTRSYISSTELDPDVEMQDQPLLSNAAVATSSTRFADLENILTPGYIASTKTDSSMPVGGYWVPPSRRNRQIMPNTAPSRRPTNTNIIDLTGDDDDDGPLDGYEGSKQRSGRETRRNLWNTLRDEGDDDDLIDVSIPLGRLESKRAKLENQLEITMRDGDSKSRKLGDWTRRSS